MIKLFRVGKGGKKAELGREKVKGGEGKSRLCCLYLFPYCKKT